MVIQSNESVFQQAIEVIELPKLSWKKTFSHENSKIPLSKNPRNELLSNFLVGIPTFHQNQFAGRPCQGGPHIIPGTKIVEKYPKQSMD